jgi:succinate-acetate transporter protein
MSEKNLENFWLCLGILMMLISLPIVDYADPQNFIQYLTMNIAHYVLFFGGVMVIALKVKI